MPLDNKQAKPFPYTKQNGPSWQAVALARRQQLKLRDLFTFKMLG